MPSLRSRFQDRHLFINCDSSSLNVSNVSAAAEALYVKYLRGSDNSDIKYITLTNCPVLQSYAK